jgi:hypothetical protein
VQASPDKALEQAAKAQKAREKAASLYPNETWGELEDHIFIARAREPKSNNQKRDLEKELVQSRILTAMGSTVYLLPEVGASKHPDAVVDGFIMEFKTITGNADRVEDHYRSSRKKADRIFFKINSDLSPESVLRKLIDRIRKGNHSGGLIIAHFTHTNKTYFWEEDRLK